MADSRPESCYPVQSFYGVKNACICNNAACVEASPVAVKFRLTLRG